MDADCLIKLTKSNLKELVCQNFSVVLPQLVKEEVVDNAFGHPDAQVIKDNLANNLLDVDNRQQISRKGEDALFTLFQIGGFDAIGSDDKRFIRRLRLLDIPYVTPAVFVAILLKNGKLNVKDSLKRLESLSAFISDEEHQAVCLIIENWRKT